MPHVDADKAQVAHLRHVFIRILQARNRYWLLYVLFVFALCTENICYSRSKLAFTRGTPSDSIAFVNAFKVMCLMPSQLWCSMDLHICLMAIVFKNPSPVVSYCQVWHSLKKKGQLRHPKVNKTTTKHELTETTLTKNMQIILEQSASS